MNKNKQQTPQTAYIGDFNVAQYPLEIEALTTPNSILKSIKNEEKMKGYKEVVSDWRSKCRQCELEGKPIPPKPKKPKDIKGAYPFEVFWRTDDVPFDGYSKTVRKLVDDPKRMKFVDSISCLDFEMHNISSISNAEILKRAGDPNSERIYSNVWEKRREAWNKEKENAIIELKPGEVPNVHAVMKYMKLEHWIVLVTMLFKAIPKLVDLIDIDVKRIAFCSQELASKGFTTISQVDTLIMYEDRKAEYINAYVLNQMLASLMETEMEQNVFVCMMQKLRDVKNIKSQKLRTAYRHRRYVLKKCVDYCRAHGYDEVWFYEHFSCLPAVQYYVETKPIAKRVKELM